MVFPTFFNFGLNLAIKSSSSESQSAPSLVSVDCIEHNSKNIMELLKTCYMGLYEEKLGDH